MSKPINPSSVRWLLLRMTHGPAEPRIPLTPSMGSMRAKITRSSIVMFTEGELGPHNPRPIETGVSERSPVMSEPQRAAASSNAERCAAVIDVTKQSVIAYVDAEPPPSHPVAENVTE